MLVCLEEDVYIFFFLFPVWQRYTRFVYPGYLFVGRVLAAYIGTLFNCACVAVFVRQGRKGHWVHCHCYGRSFKVLTDISRLAYWIAFGPHGPRAETPKGEGMKVFIQVLKYVAISFGVFYTTRLFANPPPKTMTKEWQEASNEYARVRYFHSAIISIIPLHSPNVRGLVANDVLRNNRPRKWIPSRVSAAKATPARATFKARWLTDQKKNRAYNFKTKTWKEYLEGVVRSSLLPFPELCGPQKKTFFAAHVCIYLSCAVRKYFSVLMEIGNV